MSSKGRNAPETPLWESHPQLAAIMLAALAENPLTIDLTDDQRLEIVELALREQKMNDAAWLTATALRIRGGERLLEAPVQAGKNAKPALQTDIPISRPTPVHSQEDLDAILDAHAAWIKQVLEPGLELGSGRANLKGNDLRGFQLEGRDLRAAQLEACDLRGCSLIAVNFAGANLSRAQLAGACLDRARLRRSNLSGADLSGASLRGADLRHTLLQGARLEGTDITDTVLEAAAKAKAAAEEAKSKNLTPPARQG